MNLNIIKKVTNEYLEKKSITIFEIYETNEYGMKVLEIILSTNPSSDEMNQITNDLIELLDEYIPNEYFLSIANKGAEYNLKTLDDCRKHLNAYINVISDGYKGDATLIDIEDKFLIVSYFVKGKKTKQKIDFEKISNIRTAVKF